MSSSSTPVGKDPQATPVKRGWIGVVTVTYNSAAVLPEFFDSLAGQTCADYTLYVVDNASHDETLALCRRRTDLPIQLIANERNLGVAEGNNQGIRAALQDGCEAVLLLNNDTVFAHNLLALLYAGLERFGCEMTTARMYYHDQPEMLWCAGGHFQPWRGYAGMHDGENCRDSHAFDRPRRVTYTPTCCLLVRRSVFERIGLMDSRYFVYYDDVDFLYRCLRNGISLWYVPEAKLWHKVSSLTGKLSEFTLRYCTRNRIYFLRKNLPFWFALTWYLESHLRSALALLLFHNSFRKWKVRFAAAIEGWRYARSETR